MRDIKFRAWDKKHKKIYNQGFSITPLGRILFQEFFWNDSNPSVELMQYTGLKDKNGKEIYEGDIVKLPSAKRASVVVWQAPSFVMKHKTEGGNWSKTWGVFTLMPTENQFEEVIGNIYENPELLK